MTSDRDVLDLISKIEASTRQSRPFLVFGLVAILLGFAVLIYYLDAQRRAAEKRAEQLTARVETLTATLERAQQLSVASTDTPAQLDQVLGAAIRQAGAINETAVTKPTSGLAPVGAPPRITLYLHVAEPSQYGAAKMLRMAMNHRTFGDATVLAPGVELKPGNGDNSVRCLKDVDCARIDEVVAWVNDRLETPKLRPLDLSARYEKSAKVKPGTYEIWFAPGPVELAAP